MKIVIVFPIPLESPDTRDLFDPFVKRFTDSLRAFDPGCDYELAVIFNGGDFDATTRAMRHFVDLPVKYEPSGRILDFNLIKFCRYDGRGCDIGSFQWYARNCAEPCFMVCCVTRVYAWKEGWLKRLVDERNKHGAGLYGTSCSREGGKFHVCTRCYAMDSSVFEEYPHNIMSRDQGTFFEVYDGNLCEWFWLMKQFVGVVYWNGIHLALDCKNTGIVAGNSIFRNGDQSQLLVFDKHSDAYRDAGPEEKTRLERMCFNGELL